MRVTFRPEDHTYWAGKTRIPGVSEILDLAGFAYPRTLESQLAADLARRVHRACQFLDEGELDWDSLDDETKSYVESWKRFKDALGNRLAFHACGVPVTGEILGMRYAGTPDRRATLDGRRLVIELKTGQPSQRWFLQLVAYSFALHKGPGRAPDVAAVQLTPQRARVVGGVFRTREIPEVVNAWRACVTLAYFKLSYGEAKWGRLQK